MHGRVEGVEDAVKWEVRWVRSGREWGRGDGRDGGGNRNDR